MKNSSNKIDEWRNEYIECFTCCLDLFSKESGEYRKLKKCIDELKKI